MSDNFVVTQVETDFDYKRRLIEVLCFQVLTTDGQQLDELGEKWDTPRHIIEVTLIKDEPHG
jgi:hypothetical protein